MFGIQLNNDGLGLGDLHGAGSIPTPPNPTENIATYKRPVSDIGLPTISIENESNKHIDSFDKEWSFLDKWLYCTKHFLADVSDLPYKQADRFKFGFQVMMNLMIVSFPMFVPSIRSWYTELRGAWIGFVAILVCEPSIGDTIWSLMLRFVGLILGCLWAYLSYVSGTSAGGVYLEVIITAVGAFPGFYCFVATPFAKASVLGIISMYIVLESTEIIGTSSGTILDNFTKRLIAMLVGGAVATGVQVLIFPVKSRDELIKNVANAAGSCSKLSALFAAGIEGEKNEFFDDVRYSAYSKSSKEVNGYLAKADFYKNMSKKEFRLKGSFDETVKIYGEVIYVIRQIKERIDNMAQIRRHYGSAIIDEFNDDVYQYRRQYVAAICNIMKIIESSLLNRSPLPQYIPSARIAHRRLINRVREVVSLEIQAKKKEGRDLFQGMILKHSKFDEINHTPHGLKQNFMGWSATSSAAEEIIEYVEELLDLAKLLVGVTEFKYGFLSRPLYTDWAATATRGFIDFVNKGSKTSKQEGDSEVLMTDPSIAKSSGNEESNEKSEGSDSEDDYVNLSRISTRTLSRIPKQEKSKFLSFGSLTKHQAFDGDFLGNSRKFRKRNTSNNTDGSESGNENEIQRRENIIHEEEEEEEVNSDDEKLPLALQRVVSKHLQRNMYPSANIELHGNSKNRKHWWT